MLLKLWLIGNRTSCRPIQSVILLVMKQIGLPLRGRPILLITHMITDRIGLHSVLLPLLMGCIFLFSNTCVERPIIRRGAYKKQFTVTTPLTRVLYLPTSNQTPFTQDKKEKFYPRSVFAKLHIIMQFNSAFLLNSNTGLTTHWNIHVHVDCYVHVLSKVKSF